MTVTSLIGGCFFPFQWIAGLAADKIGGKPGLIIGNMICSGFSFGFVVGLVLVIRVVLSGKLSFPFESTLLWNVFRIGFSLGAILGSIMGLLQGLIEANAE